jgi:hypothetical protein
MRGDHQVRRLPNVVRLLINFRPVEQKALKHNPILFSRAERFKKSVCLIVHIAKCTRKMRFIGGGTVMNIAIKAAAFCGVSALVVGLISGSGSGTTKPDPVAAQGPSDQMRFTSAVVSARTSYKRAPNELAAGGIRSGRQQAICNIVINQSASDRVGKITKLTSNGDGKGVISVSLAPDVQVSTWNNSLSDLGDHTLIDPNSSLFKALATMKVGDWVRFSGRFSSSGTDCVGEQSVTLQGSMTDPAFTMRFTYIKKVS